MPAVCCSILVAPHFLFGVCVCLCITMLCLRAKKANKAQKYTFKHLIEYCLFMYDREYVRNVLYMFKSPTKCGGRRKKDIKWSFRLLFKKESYAKTDIRTTKSFSFNKLTVCSIEKMKKE